MAIGTQSAPQAPPAGRRRWPVKAAVLVTVVVVVGLTVRWLTDDSSFHRSGLNVKLAGAVSQSTYVDAGVYPSDGGSRPFRIEVRSLKAQVTENTAGADIRLGVCTLRQANARVGASAEASPCSSVTPLRTGSLLIDLAKTQILLQVTPHKPGVVRVQGIDLSYRRGVRFGHQRVGGETLVTVKH